MAKADQESYSSLEIVGVPLAVTERMMKLSCLEIFVQFSFLLDMNFGNSNALVPINRNW